MEYRDALQWLTVNADGFRRGYFDGLGDQDAEFVEGAAREIEALRARVSDLEAQVKSLGEAGEEWRNECLNAVAKGREIAARDFAAWLGDQDGLLDEGEFEYWASRMVTVIRTGRDPDEGN